MQVSVRSLFKSRIYEFILHAIGWIGYLIILGLLWYYGAVDSDPATVTSFFLFSFLYLPGTFYLNIVYLIPRWLQQKRWLLYVLSIAGLIVGFSLLDYLAALFLAQTKPQVLVFLGDRLLSHSATVFLATLFAAGYRFIADWITQATLIQNLESDKKAMELAFLKSQVDPHFLFNTLNSLYAQALEENSPQTADSIARLGTLMRYNLHDSQATTIPLSKEIDYIEKYIQLQKLRYPPHTHIKFTTEISNTALPIAPMLLIPFVENAFKHGLRASQESFVNISLYLNNCILTLETRNTLFESNTNDPGGVGLKNVTQRLHLLYPEKHKLDLNPSASTYPVPTYNVKLEIQLPA